VLSAADRSVARGPRLAVRGNAHAYHRTSLTLREGAIEFSVLSVLSAADPSVARRPRPAARGNAHAHHCTSLTHERTSH
jgi:hypothetical protein